MLRRYGEYFWYSWFYDLDLLTDVVKCLATPLSGLAHIVLFAFFQQIPHHFLNTTVMHGISDQYHRVFSV